jgi:hypothetical protein
MKNRSVLLFFLLLILNQANAQILKKIGSASSELFTAAKNSIELAIEHKKIQNIYDQIEGKEFDKAEENIREYRQKYNSNTRINYLNYLFYKDVDNKNNNPIYARQYLEAAIKDYNHYYSVQDADASEKDCKNIKYCLYSITRNMMDVDKNLFYKFNKSDDSLTLYIKTYGKSLYLNKIEKNYSLGNFLNMDNIEYQKSIYYDSAIILRNNIRYKKAIEVNTIDAFREFIIKNPDANEVKEAKLIYANKSYSNAENLNNGKAWDRFLNEFYEPAILIQKAKFKSKQLRINSIIEDYNKFLEKYSNTINILTNYYDNNMESFYNSEYVTNISSLKDEILKQENLIYDFKNVYREDLEIFKANLEYLRNIKEKSDFVYIESKKEKTSVSDYSNYIYSYPNTNMSNIISIKKSDFELRKKLEEEVQKKINDSIAKIENERNEKIEAELQKERQKQQEAADPKFQFYKRLGEPGAKIVKEIMNGDFDGDPKEKVGQTCGTGTAYCKYCSRPFNYTKVYESRAWGIKLMMVMNEAMTPDIEKVLGAQTMFENQIKSKMTGHKYATKELSFDEIINKRVAAIKQEIVAIKSGNYYSCQGNPPKYCSREHQRLDSY